MTLTITKDSRNRIEVLGELHLAVDLTVRAVKDVADAVEAEASVQAPLGKTGALKAHPVDRADFAGSEGFFEEGEFLNFGESIDTRALSFVKAGEAPKFTVRGAGGRFVRATPFENRASSMSDTPERIVITLPEEPRHAKWVHDGTGIYGPNHELIRPHPPNKVMVWLNEDGNKIRAKSVKGQKPNPYLERAFVIIERTYYPARVEQLRAEIRAL